MDSKGKKRKRTKQWVFILPEGDQAGPADALSIVSFRNPGTGKPGRYLLKKGGPESCSVFEIAKYEDTVVPRSYFVGDAVHSDGAMYLCSPMDPVLLVLPLLRAAAAGGKFMLLDQILVDEEMQAYGDLEHCEQLKDGLGQICGVRGEGEYKGYQLDEARLMEYLQYKVERTSEVLERRGLSTGGGSTSALYSRSSSHSSNTSGSRKLYAIGMLSEYLDQPTTKKLLAAFGAEAMLAVPAANEPAAAAASAPVSDPSKPLEDYSKGFTAPKPAPKVVTAGQKALAKVDKKGMKSMMSFFGPSKKKRKT